MSRYIGDKKKPKKTEKKSSKPKAKSKYLRGY